MDDHRIGRRKAIEEQDPAYRPTRPLSFLGNSAWVRLRRLADKNLRRILKAMTCKQLGGACELVFSGETFDDLASQSQQHGKEMYRANDGPHMAAMGTIMELMESGEMESWMAARKAEFEAL